MAARWLVALATTTFSSLAGHLPPFRTNKIARHGAMLNSSMESLMPSREPPRWESGTSRKEEA
jgi:hypothetical protein